MPAKPTLKLFEATYIEIILKLANTLQFGATTVIVTLKGEERLNGNKNN